MAPARGTRSYARETHWRRYLPFFPETAPTLPTEEWWPWGAARIHLDRYAQPAARLTLIVLHGAGGYGRLFLPYCQALQAQGYEVVAPDLPGYGLSEAPSGDLDHDRWVDCVVSLVQAERQRNGRPVVLLGCSLGGYLGYLAAAQGRNVAGLIATTLADPRQPLVRRQFARHAWMAPMAAPLLRMFDALCGSLRLPIKWFSNMRAIANDPALARLFLQDRLGGGNVVSIHFMRSLFDAAPTVEPQHFDVCPVLLVHPAADRWTTVEASRLVFDRLPGDKQLVMLEGCGHFPVEAPGVQQMQEAVSGFLRRLAGATG